MNLNFNPSYQNFNKTNQKNNSKQIGFGSTIDLAKSFEKLLSPLEQKALRELRATALKDGSDHILVIKKPLLRKLLSPFVIFDKPPALKAHITNYPYFRYQFDAKTPIPNEKPKESTINQLEHLYKEGKFEADNIKLRTNQLRRKIEIEMANTPPHDPDIGEWY